MNKNIIHFILAITLLLIIGTASGYSVGYWKARHSSFPEIQWVRDVNPGISTIKMLKIEGGRLKGEIAGQKTRIAYHPDKILTLQPGEAFDIPLNQVLLSQYYSGRQIPENALFVASKKGKYYYSVFDSQAYHIKEENRLYFSEENEAQKAGFQKK